MTIIECPRESDVLDAIDSKRWPHRVDQELVEHVASCEICSDVLAVAAAMREDHDATWREADIPSSGQVWWRAEMRARQQAIREASRPITIAYGVAAVAALVLAVTVSWFAWPVVHDYVSSVVATAQTPALASPLTLPLLVAFGALLVIAPVALYLVLTDE
jgi:hypothetical protein